MRNRTLNILFLLLSISVSAQVTFTANDTIFPYQGYFRAGTNLGDYPGFSDEFLAEISAGNPTNGIEGLGIKALRPGLFESFLYEYGYDSRVSTYELFDDLGLTDNTLIVGFPAEIHQDPTEYCPGIPSTLFANMYLDIWDNGENGTPVNDDNHYALYIYQTAILYHQYIKFWEIWNEPGFDFTQNRGWLPPGSPGNWWENNPDPCDYKLRAPIFHYVRLLRISYEVIKSIDPEAYITVSGVGYPSFLDAVLRNTDNPIDGSPSVDYPLTAGAYFDVMGFHSYPHFDGSLRYWDNNIMDFVHTRHSDAAADGILALQDTLQGVLNNYGYDGNTFPLKPWIITEINLPRKQFGDYIGSAESQRNFIIKNVVVCMQNNFLQSHIYKLAEDKTYENAFFEFDVMGLYKKLNPTAGYFQEANDEGIAYKTASEILYEKVHDPGRTAALSLPQGVRGGAFKDENNNYTYVLWAETSIDNSESANAIYSFPANLGISNLIKREWDYGSSNQRSSIPSQNIELTGAPIFLTEIVFTADITEGCAPQVVQFSDLSPSSATSWNWTFEGGTPASSTLQNPTVTFNQEGIFSVTFQSFDTNGNLLATQSDIINIGTAPEVDFSFTMNGPLVAFQNLSGTNSSEFLWNFGDGTTSSDPSPNHLYLTSGTYTVQLTALNNCGSISEFISLDIIVSTNSQLTFTANDQVPSYDGIFRPGSNTSYYPPWSDEQLGDIAAGNIIENQQGAGVKSIRTILPHYFLEFWGYDIEKSTFEHYNNLDLRENVATIGFPASSVRDTVAHCPEIQSSLFENLYLDIWDNGANGTPVNDNNEFAKYLYHTVNTYKDNIRFWEIMSGPDFDASGEKGWLPPGEDGNWWENNPDPCDYALHAPIQYYVRMLRISYEIIKTLDPDSYVTIAGIGFPSFLDAVLRNTDNPIDGSIISGYPHKGGAYFDAIAYNSLPHFDGSTIYYDTNVGDFVYERHSDAAANGILNLKNEFQDVLIDYGYEGNTYPEKQWYISSCNIPRKQFGNFIGGDSAQKNFIIKAYIQCIKNNIEQFHVRELAETASYSEANDPFQMMGLYENLEGTTPYNQSITNQGKAYKTTSDLLFGTTYDAVRTAALMLPDEIDGAALVDGNGDYTYVLWAKTWIDFAETASATYTFPGSFGLTQLNKKEWNYSETNINTLISTTNIELTGTPIFLTEAEQPLLPPLAQFSSDIQDGCSGINVVFQDESLRADTWNWTFVGGSPEGSTLQNPVVSYATPGNYQVMLEASNAAGSHIAIKSDFIIINDTPTADFIYTIDGFTVDFINASDDATAYLWNFGDNSTTLSFNPEHTYADNGNYDVTLIASNDCGNDTIVQQIILSNAPIANFAIDIENDCNPYTVNFEDQSSFNPTQWSWIFNNGNPTTSNIENPTVVFDNPGNYEAILIASNEFGSDTITQIITLDPQLIFNFNATFCENDSVIINDNIYSVTNPTGYEVLEGEGINGCDSIVIINIQNGDAANEIFATICEGDIYDTGEIEFSETGVYNYNITNHVGCDSMITLTLNVAPTYYIELSDTIQEGEIYTVGSVVYDTTGIYETVLTTINGCDSIIHLDLHVDILNDLSNFSKDFNLKYFPNPFSKNFTLEFDLQKSAPVSIDLYDIRGVKVEQFQSFDTLQSGVHTYHFIDANLPQGVYLFHLRINDEQLTFRIVHL
jgi:PKD repeat protein